MNWYEKNMIVQGSDKELIKPGEVYLTKNSHGNFEVYDNLWDVLEIGEKGDVIYVATPKQIGTIGNAYQPDRKGEREE